MSHDLREDDLNETEQPSAEEKQLPTPPADAYVYYETRTMFSGVSVCDSEEKARRVAANERGNGSGRIVKKTSWTEHYGSSEKAYASARFSMVEELEPVTEFYGRGVQNREKYLAKLVCEHPTTHTVSSGAGCSHDVDIICSFCGKYV
jgi:hypothetical protein